MKVVHTQHMRTAVGTDSTQHTTVPHPQAGDGGQSMQTDGVRTTVNTALPKLGSGGHQRRGHGGVLQIARSVPFHTAGTTIETLCQP